MMRLIAAATAVRPRRPRAPRAPEWSAWSDAAYGDAAPEPLSAKLSGAWLGTLATDAAILLCGLVTGILSARLLAPEGRGALAAVLFWPHVVTRG